MCAIESGKATPSLDALCRIASLLKTSPGELLGENPLLKALRDVVAKYGYDAVFQAFRIIKENAQAKGESHMSEV